MEERSIEEIAADDKREMYRLDRILHVAHNVHIERYRCIVSVRQQIEMDLHPRVVQYVQRAGLLPVARLTDYWFKVDEPLISAFIERCDQRPIRSTCRGASALSPSRMSHTS
ncbi:hypothetical protein PIB30_005774 [Stylosanthes scabra]|uniref:Uncharacterized protein n=1 Tax=Stylosanthes scabra TaxID=79078 RepID=A0ABU6W5X8_9FABA|nr:hypothetical protein [Stylosanthes scabra]